MKVKNFVVYDVYYCGFLAYVGSGENDRPNHVTSGCSHNDCLNELNIRSKVFGEPDVSIKIHKYFDKKEDSLLCEKSRISRLKPLFNKTHRGSMGFKILSKTERDLIRSKDINLLERVERIENMGNCFGVNPNLVFTPYDFRCEVQGVKYDSACFDLVSISTFGMCTFLDDYFEYYIDHNDLVVIKALPDTISKLNQIVGNSRFVNYLDKRKQGNKPLFARDDYNPNYNGSAISENCHKYLAEDIVLARKLNTYKGIDIVLCLRVSGGVFDVFCLNNNQIIYTTTDSSDALEAHRNTDLIRYEFLTRVGEDSIVSTLILDNCKDFK